MSAPEALNRNVLRLVPDSSRVVIRPFKPATEPRDFNVVDRERADHIVHRVLGLDESTALDQLRDVLASFEGRHRGLLRQFERRADEMEAAFSHHAPLSQVQRQLVGAYFLHEYSFEASALFNPSIVSHPDQSGLEDGDLRFIMSLRAVGEGHISSITFRSGLVRRSGEITLDPPARFASVPTVTKRIRTADGEEVEVAFSPSEDLSERVVFPLTESQSNGIEDARFVLFEDDGVCTYYATYTAYSGRAIRSELIETRDFQTFRLRPMTGSAARNKGMALFPRKLDGGYAMIGRQDNENLYLIRSNNLTQWDGGTIILRPKHPWEYVQIGNCGSPIELDEGWLVLTHGVGAVRRYAIGAVLLDRADPTKVLARSPIPLIQPEPHERSGYVPNVVYTCGAIRHGDRIILPYAVADTFTQMSTVKIQDLLQSLEPAGG